MFDKLNAESKFNAFAFIKQIREQRACLVQTFNQYVFIHEALYEYSLFGFTDTQTVKFISNYNNLIDKGVILESEFEVIKLFFFFGIWTILIPELFFLRKI